MRLEGKAAIVTGGSAGIGRAICERFAEEGARVAIADVDVYGGEETVRLIRQAGGEATFTRTDVSVESDVEAMVADAMGTFGTVDVLVNDAAVFVFGAIEDVTGDDWQRVMGVNLVGAANTVKHTIPHMKAKGGGAIVNVASVSSFIAQPAFVPYNASKGALLQLTRCLALDLARHNIRVNCVCPGSITTAASERHRKFIGATVEEYDRLATEGAYLKRVGQPREVANGVLFLASDEASFITGTPLVIDGGGVA